MPLLDPNCAFLRIEVLQLQADGLRNPRAGVEARFANQKLRIFETRKDGGGLIVVEDALRADCPLPADLHPRHRIRERLWYDLPLLAAGEDPTHDVPQVDHHMPR